MQAQQKLFNKIVVSLNQKVSTFAILSAMYIPVHHALCCLAFIFFLLCSVFKVQIEGCTLKIEQCKKLKRSDLGMLHETCDLVRSP